jgi:hypothetical protein
MRRQLWIGLLVGVIAYGACCASVRAQAAPDNTQKSARIELIQEFVRELEVLYRLHETARKEVVERSGAEKLTAGIRNGTRLILRMLESIDRLDRINVDGEWAEFRDLLKLAYQQRIELAQEVNQMSKTFLSAPEPGVNYGKLDARGAVITVQLEEIDKGIFSVAQGLSISLIDDARVGADGRLYHLILTKKDRTSMVKQIDKIFGATLEDKKANNYIVSSARVLKLVLTRPNYRSADEI